MCCWFLGVCLQVLANLLRRFGEDIVLTGGKMCAMCCCRCRSRNDKSRLDIIDNYAHPRKLEDDSFKSINREAAETLLASRQNGTFIVRPSTHSDAVGTLSVHQDGRIYHLPIRRRRDRQLALGTPKPQEKCFPDLNTLINYHISNYLILYADNKSARTLLLPYNTPVPPMK